MLCGLLSLPQSIKIDKIQFLMVMKVKRLWINEIFLRRRVRGFTLGNTVLLSDVSESNTYSHEIIHIKQFMRMPFIFPVLYCVESIRNGYRNNKYEEEAYQAEKIVSK